MIRIGLISLIGLIGMGAGPDTIYQFKMKSIDGTDLPFEKLKGKVLLAVNVASR